MRSLVPRLAVLAGALSFAAPAAACATTTTAPSRVEAKEHLEYPATAAAFRDHVSARVAQARARVEQYIADAKLDAKKADEVRARFQAAIVKIDAKVDEVCADGTVTEPEALAVHELAKALRHNAHDD